MFTRIRAFRAACWSASVQLFITLKDANPGISLVGARSGIATFNIRAFSDYLRKGFNITLPPYIEVPLSTIAFVSAAVTTTVTRFFNVYRRNKAKRIATPIPSSQPMTSAAESDAEDAKLLQRPESKINPQPTCCYPGVETQSSNIGYIFSQIMTGLYGGGSAISSFLSIDSLIWLLRGLFNFSYQGSCGEGESNVEGVILSHLAILVLTHANITSLLNYNVPLIREYYRRLFIEARLFTPDNELFEESIAIVEEKGSPVLTIEPVTELYDAKEAKLPFTAKKGFLYSAAGARIFSCEEKIYYKNTQGNSSQFIQLTLKKGWQEIKPWDHAGVFINTFLWTVGQWYASQKIVDFWQDKTLCHLRQAPVIIPGGFSKFFSAVNCTASHTVNTVMGLGAIFNLQEKNRTSTIPAAASQPVAVTQPANEEKNIPEEEISEFGCLDKPISLCMIGNALTVGIGIFAFAVLLPDSLAGNTAIITSPLIIAFGILCFIIAYRVQRKLDLEGRLREETTRKLRREVTEAKAVASTTTSPNPTPTTPATHELAARSNDAKGTAANSGMFSASAAVSAATATSTSVVISPPPLPTLSSNAIQQR